MLATYPSANEGLTCDTNLPECGVPRNAVLQIRFDRYIDPARAVRQSVLISSGSEVTVFGQPEYDVVERVLLFRPLGDQLPERVTFSVVILSSDEDERDGLRAFDGAPLEAGPVPLRFDFRTNGLPLDPPSLPAEPTPTCNEVLDVFSRGDTCAGTSCHVRNDPSCPPGYGMDGEQRCVAIPRMGMVLQDATGLLMTAIGKVAHQTETGSKGGTTLENPPRFGVQMPIIDPGRPDNSYLLYKLLRNPANYDADVDPEQIDDPCASRYPDLGPADRCAAPGDFERRQLQEWFVRGDPMPMGKKRAPLSGELVNNRITHAELRTIQAWIRGQAPCP